VFLKVLDGILKQRFFSRPY